jgi:hypothetical protein
MGGFLLARENAGHPEAIRAEWQLFLDALLAALL